MILHLIVLLCLVSFSQGGCSLPEGQAREHRSEGVREEMVRAAAIEAAVRLAEAAAAAEARLARAEDRLARAEDRLARAEDRLARAEDRLARAEAVLARIEGQ